MKGGKGVSVVDDHHPIGSSGGGWGLSWPPRFYTCNFCRREFRSAQALGGHMNVHRRDRARLRLQSPNPNPNLSLNLTPNPNSPTPTTLASSSNHHNRVFSRYKHVGHPSSPKCSAIFDPKKLLVMKRQNRTTRARGVLKLGLEIGIFDRDDDEDDDEDEDEEEVEEDLDLELRLGYSH